MTWESVIGLEVHIQLDTKSKLFSGSPTTFGAKPNTQANIIDMGLPGVLPTVNEEALYMAARFGLSIGANINMINAFERKNYFYPDLPKGYQTTQLFHPVVGGNGVISINTDAGLKNIRIHHAHLEEDAGKSLHEDYCGMTGVDFNRAGTPLLEVVSEPDCKNAQEAIKCLKYIHSLVRYLGISNADMSQGSIRCDANVSIKPSERKELGTRAEIKNLNSFRFIERAINYEIDRQIDLLNSGQKVVQETRLYDSELNETRSMRSKEEANDYRYFPCPDLLPIFLDEQKILHIKESMPELPTAKKERFITEFKLNDYDADRLVEDRETAYFFEKVTNSCNDAKLAANWILGEMSNSLKIRGLTFKQSPITVEMLGGILSRIIDETISGKIAKQVFEIMWEGDGQTADEIIENHKLRQVQDTGIIEKIIDDILSQNIKQVQNYLAATSEKRKKMLGFFVGKIMQASNGKANPAIAHNFLTEKLKSLESQDKQ